MRTYPINDDHGRLRAFEIDNLLIGRRSVVSVMRSLPGARVVREPLFLSGWREDTFAEVDIDGVTFIAFEPFGDSNRYWIGPPDGFSEKTDLVREAFERCLPNSWRRVANAAVTALVAAALLAAASRIAGGEALTRAAESIGAAGGVGFVGVMLGARAWIMVNGLLQKR